MDIPTLKILLIGNSSVGKSALLLRYCSDLFDPEDASATIGVDFKAKTLNVNGRDVRLVIWDTAGQERFRTLTSSYYRGSHAVLLVYDVTNRETFDALPRWFGECETFASAQAIKVIVGNKIDKKRVVSREEGEVLAKEYGARYIEASAKMREGVKAAFTSLTETIVADSDVLGTKDGTSLDLQSPVSSSCAC